MPLGSSVVLTPASLTDLLWPRSGGAFQLTLSVMTTAIPVDDVDTLINILKILDRMEDDRTLWNSQGTGQRDLSALATQFLIKFGCAMGKPDALPNPQAIELVEVKICELFDAVYYLQSCVCDSLVD